MPFGLTIYGYGGYDGYGYPGGFTLSPIATVNTVSLSVGSGAGVVGTQACPTATATDQNGDPVAGVLVNYTITGANRTSGSLYDAVARHSTATPARQLGDDQIVASVETIQSAPGAWVWTQAAATTTSVSTSLSGGGSTGASISVLAGTQVTDAATVSGANAATASGTVTYNVYTDAACTDPVSSGTALSITTPGTLPASAGHAQ